MRGLCLYSITQWSWWCDHGHLRQRTVWCLSLTKLVLHRCTFLSPNSSTQGTNMMPSLKDHTVWCSGLLRIRMSIDTDLAYQLGASLIRSMLFLLHTMFFIWEFLGFNRQTYIIIEHYTPDCFHEMFFICADATKSNTNIPAEAIKFIFSKCIFSILIILFTPFTHLSICPLLYPSPLCVIFLSTDDAEVPSIL